MTSLVIVESPAKAKTISNFLGKGYRVEASFGHVRDLPASKKEVPEAYKKEKWAEFAVNIEDQFQPIYVISPEKRKHVTELKKALKDADELILATDEDREGESISWHLLELLKPKVPVHRIVFHEITREAIKEAMATPRKVDENLVRAQESRRIVDRLFGYKLSPVLWRKIQRGLSAGRVQSAALRLIVEREEERRAFHSSVYWDLEAEIDSPTGPFKATLVSVGGKRLATGKDFDPATGKLKNDSVFHLDNEEKTTRLLERVRGALPWEVSAVEEKPATQRPYPPFTTSTLQQEANRKLGYPAKRTMRIAQRLYEGIDLGDGERVGLITYMRTDSVVLSERAMAEAQQVIKRQYGEEYARGFRPYKTKTRNAQEAHEAIRPTELGRLPQSVKRYLDKEELDLYELIWKRTLASQMPDAKLLRTNVEITAESGEGKKAVFTTSGKKITFPGFLRAYVEGSDDPNADIGDKEVILPDLQPGQKVHDPKAASGGKELTLKSLGEKHHETQPPARFSEAALVKKLEDEGIGRPSTYASIISTIQDRGYVFLNKSRQLVPTFVAMAAINLLRKHFEEYVDLKFTARMEEELDQIADGQIEWIDHVRSFFRGTPETPGLESLVDSKAKTIDFPDTTIGEDPESGQKIDVRIGKYGPYLVRGENGSGTIANIPKETAPADLTLEKALELLNQKEDGPRNLGVDPDTQLPVYTMVGRFGAYVQLGETPEDKKAPKPRRASLDPGQQPDTITLGEALELLSYPKELGTHPETGKPVIVNKGRFGPYVGHEKDFRSLKKTDEIGKVTLERALELLAEPKRGRGGASASKNVLKDLGKNSEGTAIQLLEGRYGPYVSDGKTNATLPKGSDPESLTLEKGLELIAAKAKAGGGAKKGTRKKKA